MQPPPAQLVLAALNSSSNSLNSGISTASSSNSFLLLPPLPLIIFFTKTIDVKVKQRKMRFMSFFPLSFSSPFLELVVERELEKLIDGYPGVFFMSRVSLCKPCEMAGRMFGSVLDY